MDLSVHRAGRLSDRTVHSGHRSDSFPEGRWKAFVDGGRPRAGVAELAPALDLLYLGWMAKPRHDRRQLASTRRPELELCAPAGACKRDPSCMEGRNSCDACGALDG